MVARRLPRWSQLRELVQFEPLLQRPTRRRLRRAHTVADLRELARRRTPRAVFDYVDGAAEAEIGLSRARAAFAAVEFVPRVLTDVSTVDTEATLLGKRATLPVVLAPTGFTRLMHHAGEAAVARAAARAGLPYTLSTMGTTAPEAVATAAPAGRRWFQLYLQKDRRISTDLVDRALRAGYDTLMLTVDTPVGGARLRDLHNGFTIPPRLRARTVVDLARYPAWWFNLLTTEPLRFAALTSWQATVAELADQMFDPTATIDDLARLRERWPHALVVKGVLTVADACRVVEAGADAVVVSSHGARQLDRAPTPLEVLPAVAAALSGRAEVYVDTGVMSGADVVACVALGATGVLIGRAYLYGLMAAGEPGVDRALALLREEVTRTLQLLGVPRVADLCAEHVRLRAR